MIHSNPDYSYSPEGTPPTPASQTGSVPNTPAQQVLPQQVLQEQTNVLPEAPTVVVQESPVASAPTSLPQGVSPAHLTQIIEPTVMEINSTDILNLYRDHATIERAVLKESGDTRASTTAGFGAIAAQINATADNINTDIKSTGWLINDRVQDEADRVTNQATQFYISSQQRANEIAATAAAAEAASVLATAKLEGVVQTAAAAGLLETARLANAVALGNATLSKEIFQDGSATRALIVAQNEANLNRQLIERNTEVVAERTRAYDWERHALNGNYAALSSNINALGSQLSEARQGIVNFGKMDRGAGQQTASNMSA